jgi:hypothetical protein
MSLGIEFKKLGQKRWVCYNVLVNETATTDSHLKVWGPYPNYDDEARFEYGRRMWRLPDMRARLLQHWTDASHPYRDRFLCQRELIEQVLDSTGSPEELDRRLRERRTSLRCIAREIPPVFGSFF